MVNKFVPLLFTSSVLKEKKVKFIWVLRPYDVYWLNGFNIFMVYKVMILNIGWNVLQCKIYQKFVLGLFHQ